MKKTIDKKKKLELNKDTLRKLTNTDLAKVQGGLSALCTKNGLSTSPPRYYC